MKRKRKAIVLITVKRDGLELSLFPWEEPNAILDEIEAFLAETDARPWLNERDAEELTAEAPKFGRPWSGEPTF